MPPPLSACPHKPEIVKRWTQHPIKLLAGTEAFGWREEIWSVCAQCCFAHRIVDAHGSVFPP